MRILLAVALVLATGLVAQSPAKPVHPPQETPTPSQPFGSLRVQVKEAKGTALAGALVAIEKLNRGHDTEADGNVQMGWIPVGKHEVRVSKAGFKPAVLQVEIEQEKIAVITVQLKADVK